MYDEFDTDGADMGSANGAEASDSACMVPRTPRSSAPPASTAASPQADDWKEWLLTGEDPEDVAIMKRCKNRQRREKRKTEFRSRKGMKWLCVF